MIPTEMLGPEASETVNECNGDFSPTTMATFLTKSGVAEKKGFIQPFRWELASPFGGAYLSPVAPQYLRVAAGCAFAVVEEHPTLCNSVKKKPILRSTWGSAIMRHENASYGGEAKKALHRDIIGLLSAFGIAIVLVFFLDTGSLADWVAKHKDTKIDEIIVVTMMLVITLGFISRLELSRQLKKYEELYGEMTQLNWESTLLGELGDLL
jgi:hypothetical protein